MAILYANNASSLLAAGITNVATTLTVTAGEGTKFPTPTGGNYFKLTVQDSTGNYEIMHCTARSTDTLTVTRGQEGTTARAFSTGAVVENRFTADSISSFNTYAFASNAEATAGALTNVMMHPANTKYFWDQRVTPYGASIIDDVDAATARTTLGLGSAATLTAGTAANNVVQLNGSAYLPAVDGRNLTNLGVTARAYTQTQYPTALALTSSAGALAVDCDTCSLATNTLTANTTVSAATNQTAGKIVELVITGASTYTLSWNANWKATDLVALPTAPAAGKRLWVVAESDGTYMILKSALKEL